MRNSQSHIPFHRTIQQTTVKCKINTAIGHLASQLVVTPSQHSHLNHASSGQVFRLRGKGVPHLKGGGQGDQFVTVKIIAPKNLDVRSQELLREFARLNPEDPRLKTA